MQVVYFSEIKNFDDKVFLSGVKKLGETNLSFSVTNRRLSRSDIDDVPFVFHDYDSAYAAFIQDLPSRVTVKVESQESFKTPRGSYHLVNYLSTMRVLSSGCIYVKGNSKLPIEIKIKNTNLLCANVAYVARHAKALQAAAFRTHRLMKSLTWSKKPEDVFIWVKVNKKVEFRPARSRIMTLPDYARFAVVDRIEDKKPRWSVIEVTSGLAVTYSHTKIYAAETLCSYLVERNITAKRMRKTAESMSTALTKWRKHGTTIDR